MHNPLHAVVGTMMMISSSCVSVPHPKNGAVQLGTVLEGPAPAGTTFHHPRAGTIVFILGRHDQEKVLENANDAN